MKIWDSVTILQLKMLMLLNKHVTSFSSISHCRISEIAISFKNKHLIHYLNIHVSA